MESWATLFWNCLVRGECRVESADIGAFPDDPNSRSAAMSATSSSTWTAMPFAVRTMDSREATSSGQPASRARFWMTGVMREATRSKAESTAFSPSGIPHRPLPQYGGVPQWTPLGDHARTSRVPRLGQRARNSPRTEVRGLSRCHVPWERATGEGYREVSTLCIWGSYGCGG